MASDVSPVGRRLSRLRAEAQLLMRRYGHVTFDQQDGTWLYAPRFQLPSGWNKQEVEILIDIPYGNPGYPSVAPQWFWTDRDLCLPDGRPIAHFFAEAPINYVDQEYLDKGWGHFCVHINTWRPANDLRIQEGHNLMSYLDLIALIFRDSRSLG